MDWTIGMDHANVHLTCKTTCALQQGTTEGASQFRRRATGRVQVQCRLHLPHVPREDQLPADAVSALCYFMA